MSKHIRILGAGPAGLTTAIVLAKNGERVAVYDRRPGVGYRFNDDFQGLENWSVEKNVIAELTEMGLTIDFFCKPFRGGRIYNPKLIPLEVSSPYPLFYLVKRGRSVDTLDRVLERQALEAGVELHYNQILSPHDVDVVATGPRGTRAIAAGITFETNRLDYAYGTVGDELAPQGYTYLLIADGKATLATVLFSDFPKASICLDKAIKTYQKLLDLNIVNPRYWGGYGNFNVPQTAVEEGRLYIGEAAGFQDMLFGFGIRTAMISGYLAAQSILLQTNYDKLWKSRFLPMLKASQANRLLYAHLGKIAYYFLWHMIGRNRRPDKFMRWLYSWRQYL